MIVRLTFTGAEMFKEYDPLSDKTLQILNEEGKIVNEKWKPDLSNEKVIEGFRDMLFAREMDTMMLSYQRQGRMFTFPPNKGQEAVSIGTGLVIRRDDWLVPAFRELGAWIMKGAVLRDIFLYWRGDEDGSLWRGAENFLPSTVPISSQLLHAVGLGYAIKYRKEDKAVFTFFGDGGTSEGDFHEALNFASVWKVPVIFINQNNQYAISVPVGKQTASKNLAVKSYAYGMRGIKVDGNDLFAVYASVAKAAELARKGEGPTLIECFTYRLGSHTTSDDPTLYRNKEEEDAWAKKDPIDRLRKYLTAKKLWSGSEEKKFLEGARKKIDSAFIEAENYREYPLENVFKYMYSAVPEDLKKQQLRYERFQKWMQDRK
jgi:pyruvate dehydrogenase E1 component alpha subunit